MYLAWILCCFADVSISLIGDDILEVTESSMTVNIVLEVGGISFGSIPLRFLPVSYSEFEVLKEEFGVNMSLADVVRSRVFPAESALPCEYLMNVE